MRGFNRGYAIVKPKGKRHLKPEQALAIVALVRAGEHRADVAGRFDIGIYIMSGRA